MQVSNAEWQVMKVIWTQDNLTSREITQALSEKFDWTASTVKTLLSRLVEKNCLSTKKEGKRFFYSPLLTEEESIHQITKDVSEKVCAMNMNRIIEELIIRNDFTIKDLDNLEHFIQEKRELAVTHVQCTCI